MIAIQMWDCCRHCTVLLSPSVCCEATHLYTFLCASRIKTPQKKRLHFHHCNYRKLYFIDIAKRFLFFFPPGSEPPQQRYNDCNKALLCNTNRDTRGTVKLKQLHTQSFIFFVPPAYHNRLFTECLLRRQRRKDTHTHVHTETAFSGDL